MVRIVDSGKLVPATCDVDGVMELTSSTVVLAVNSSCSGSGSGNGNEFGSRAGAISGDKSGTVSGSPPGICALSVIGSGAVGPGAVGPSSSSAAVAGLGCSDPEIMKLCKRRRRGHGRQHML